MRRIRILDVVALLNDKPEDKLARGQVGTAVERLAEDALLVEFSDDDGRAYAIVPCSESELMVLYYVPQARVTRALRATLPKIPPMRQTTPRINYENLVRPSFAALADKLN